MPFNLSSYTHCVSWNDKTFMSTQLQVSIYSQTKLVGLFFHWLVSYLIFWTRAIFYFIVRQSLNNYASEMHILLWFRKIRREGR